MFNYLVLLSFLTNAQATIHIEDMPSDSMTFTSTKVDQRYSIETTTSGSNPALHVKQEPSKTGKFLKSGLTFEEQCVLAKKAPSCVHLSTTEYFPFDPAVAALYAPGDIHISHPQMVKFDNVCLISKGDIVVESDKIQMSGFVRTPGILTLQSRSSFGSIKRLDFSPYKFNFRSMSGFDMHSSSLFISTDIDFEKGIFNIQYQCVGSVGFFEDRVEFKSEQTSAPLRKKRKVFSKVNPRL